jgi:predicted RNA methylase
VLQRFKIRHLAKFGVRVPLIIPEATILAVQLICQNYDFHGYHAPVPFFLEAGAAGDSTVEMSEPTIYSVVEYVSELPELFVGDKILCANASGTVNAVRFITKNTVGLFPRERRSADWHMPYLSLPLLHSTPVQAGDKLRLRFQYEAGGSIESLQSSLQLTRA